MNNEKMSLKILTFLIMVLFTIQIESSSLPENIVILEPANGLIKSLAPSPKLGIETINGFEHLAYWSRPGDRVEWNININKAQNYQIIIEAACPTYSAGNTAEIKIGNKQFTFIVTATAGWQSFQYFVVHPDIYLEAGPQILTIAAKELKRNALMNLHGVILLPVHLKSRLNTIISDRQKQKLLIGAAYQEITAGDKLSQTGNHEAALIHYKKAVQIYPNYGNAYHKLGWILYAKLNRYQEAVPFLQKALLFIPYKINLYHDLIFAAQKARQWDTVFKITNRLISLFQKRNVTPPIWLYTNAAVWSLWSITPKNPELAAKYAKIAAYGNYTDVNLIDKAFNLLINALKDSNNMEECLKQIHYYLEKGKSPIFKGRFLVLEATYIFEKFEDEDKYIKLNKQAVQFYNEALNQVNLSNKKLFADIHFHRSIAFFNCEQFQEAYESALKAVNVQPDNTYYKNHLASCALKTGYIALGDKKFTEALQYLNYALKLRPGDTEKRLVEICKKRMKMGTIQPQYYHRFMGLFIMNSDINGVVNYHNKPKSYRGKILKKQIRSVLLSQKVFTLYLEYLTGGKVSAVFNNIHNGSTLVDVRKFGYRPNTQDYAYEPDTNAIIGDMNHVIFKNAEKYDTRIYFWRAGGFTSVAVGGGVSPFYVPYNLQGSFRGYITAPVEFFGNGDFLLLHEFWHVIENIVPIKPGHAWTPEFIGIAKKNFPNWHGNTEWSWYQYHAQHTIPNYFKAKAKKLSIKKTYKLLSFQPYYGEKIKQFVIDTYLNKIQNIDRVKLKTAFLLYQNAMEKLNAGNKEAAIKLFDKVLENNPYHHQTLNEVGKLAFEKKDYNSAYSFFKRVVDVCPTEDKFFKYSRNFFHVKLYKQSLFFAKKGYQLYESNALLHGIIRSYRSLNDKENAAKYLQLLGRIVSVQDSEKYIILHAENAQILNSENRMPWASIENIYGQYSLGNWGNLNDFIKWQYEISNPGKFIMEIEWACKSDQAGSIMRIQCGDNTVQFTVKPTESWVDFHKIKLRQVISLSTGRGFLTLMPIRKANGAFMNIRSIKLIRAIE